MALFFTAQSSSLFLSQSLKLKTFLSQTSKPSFTLPLKPRTHLNSSPFVSLSSSRSNPTPESDSYRETPRPINITDEWGEKSELGSEPEPTKLPDYDPPRNEDEWEEECIETGNGTTAAAQGGASDAAEKEAREGFDDRVADLKRCLVDSVYGTELGFRASKELRAEVLELVSQLEAVNPTPAPVEATQLLDGNWILLYTAFSELLPLLAAGATPLLKVKSISQTIDTASQSIVNSTTLSGPFADFSFSASATFEVRSPSRIQVEFKEGILQPPEVKPAVDLPADVEIFGQRISLLPVQQSLNPLQELAANISRTISGQPPLKIPIPGNRSSSWLLTTYLDEDIWISRGDGALFVLARQGSPLLEQ
ncbi:putative plastid-lipid-associated protein 3 [Hibiscus syriacus]|uniref:Plastid-lipid-associated protein 3 n=1 Tax=Hibiscus syriacus TaxID=106335 RepID=A0A6A3CM28_HIBSY|nr:plastid lipid-associated protein 3, chloroplastic-like [Hibiscus syriacus]KAE8728401.1 putative plastid-lipid-associated protein 3 [Hibiscus syriacus]